MGRGERRWWPALDGLRGLAVVAVVAYHLEESLVPGGFLGVSLFFSISGFLIVGQLTVEHDANGRVDLGRFWGRRLRRLAPAFSVTLIVTVFLVAFRAPDALDRVLDDARAGVGYVANWRDMFASGTYADRFGAGVEPLGHLWSLSIEEQVYLAAPVAVGAWGVRRTGWLAAALVAVGVVVWWGSTDAYFATPVRLVEVAAGAALGVRVFRGSAPPRWLVRAAGPATIVMGVAFATVADADPRLFRLGLPLFSMVWVAVIAGAVGGGLGGRALSLPALRWIGARSYAIYLFHVPLIELTSWSAAEVVAVTLLAAELSHRYVEAPIKRETSIVPALVAALAVLVALPGVVAVGRQLEPDVAGAVVEELDSRWVEAGAHGTGVTAGALPRPSTAVMGAVVTADAEVALTGLAALPSPEEFAILLTASTADPSPTSPPATATVSTTIPPAKVIAEPTELRLVTVGDSTVVALQPALSALLAFHGGELMPSGVAGCSPLFTVEVEWDLRFNQEPSGEVGGGYCRLSVGEILAARGPADAVLMVDHGMAMVDHRPVGSDRWMSVVDDEVAAALFDRYDRWADEATSAGAVLALATAPPASPESIATLGADASERVEAYNEIVRRVAGRAGSGVVLVDLGAAVAADPERYPRDDGVHFSRGEGAVAVVVDVLAPALGEIAAR